MGTRNIETILHDLHDLPTLPEVVAKILQTVEDEQSSAQDLSEILEKDHAISVRVLRLANSAFFGFRGKVANIRRALVVVGFEAIRLLALSTSVFDMLSRKSQIAFDPRDFWMHSLGAAKAAQLLARGRTDLAASDGCFTAALLHDVGKYALGLSLKDEYRQLWENARKTQQSLRDVERENLGVDHTDAAAWLGQHWGFPPLLTDTIVNQYHPIKCVSQPADIAICALASDLSHAAGFGDAGDVLNHPQHDQIVEALGLDKGKTEELTTELQAFKEETMQFFEMLSQN